MLESGGWPIVVTEAQVAAANHLARAHTGIDVDHTGSAGLAGVIALRAGASVVAPTERVAVVLSGRGRKTLGSGLYFSLLGRSPPNR
jgi:threonine synthase